MNRREFMRDAGATLAAMATGGTVDLGSIAHVVRPHVPAMRAELLSRARAKLSVFSRLAWRVLEPTTPLEWNWHLDALCDHVQAVLDGWMAVQRARAAGLPDPPQPLRNLVVNVPPGTGKSRFVSVFAPAWMWLKWPSWRAIFVSGNPRVALRDADLCRLLLESEWYRESFDPDWTLARDQNAKSLYRNTAGGSRMAIGAGAKVTGDRADSLFMDDPNDADEVASVALREGVIEYYDSALGNRVNDLRCSTRFLIQQRLHERDLSGHLLAQGGWEHLMIPQEYEPDRARATAIGWTDPRTTAGELMFPSRFPTEVVAAEKNRMGAVTYAGQHQQRPVPAGGAMFKAEWLKVIDPSEVPPLVRTARGWDLAATDPNGSNDPDHTAGVKLGIDAQGTYYVLNVRRTRSGPLGTEQFVQQTAQMDGRATSIRLEQEPGSSGKTVAFHYLNNVLRGYAARAQTSTGDKATRAAPFSAACERGAVRVVRGDWVPEYIDELTRFPRGAHDDQVDGTSNAFEELATAATVTRMSSSFARQ